MPQAPCNDFCRGDCKKGCAFNLLCLCCDECIEPPSQQSSMLLSSVSAPAPYSREALKSMTPRDALVQFFLHDDNPNVRKARKLMTIAIRETFKDGDCKDKKKD